MRKFAVIAISLVFACSGLTSAFAADSLEPSKTTPYKANIAGVGDIWKGEIPTAFEFPLGSYSQTVEFPIQGILPYAVLADRATGTDVEFELWSTVGKKIAYTTIYSFNWNPIGPNTLVSFTLRETEAIGSHVLIIRTIYETKTNGLLTSYLKQEIQLPVTVTGKKKEQSITATKLIDRNLSSGSFSFYSSDFKSSEYSLTVIVSSLTPSVCSISGSTVKLLDEGICTLEGRQPGNSSIMPAQPVTSSFNVTKKSQTLTTSKISDKNLSLGSFSLYSADFRSSESSLSVEIDSLTKSVCTVSGSQVKLISPGKCTLQGSQGGTLGVAAAVSVTSSFNVIGGKPSTITDMSATRGSDDISYSFKEPISDYPIQKYEVMIQTLTASNLAPNMYANYGPYTLLKTVNSEDFQVTLAEIKSYLEGNKVSDITNTSIMVRVRAISEGGVAEWGDGVYSETKNFGWLTPAQEKAAADLKAKQEAEAKAAAAALLSLQYSNRDRCSTLNKRSEDLKVLISNYQSKYPSSAEFNRLSGQIPNLLDCENFQDKTFATLVSTLDFNLSLVDADLTAAIKTTEAKPLPAKKTTITCVKGKLTKKVTAVNPKCPAGYKKK